jgi:hypothetical protein
MNLVLSSLGSWVAPGPRSSRVKEVDRHGSVPKSPLKTYSVPLSTNEFQAAKPRRARI